VSTILLPCVFFLLSGVWGPYSGSLGVPSSWEQMDVLLLTPLFFRLFVIFVVCVNLLFLLCTYVNLVLVPSFHLISITTHHYICMFTYIVSHGTSKFKTFLHSVNNMDTACLVNSSICVVYMFPFSCYFCYVQFNSLSAKGW